MRIPLRMRRSRIPTGIMIITRICANNALFCLFAKKILDNLKKGPHPTLFSTIGFATQFAYINRCKPAP